MEANQLKLLLKLAKEIEKEAKDRKTVDGVVDSLLSAKILDKKGQFTGHYNNLNKLFITM